MGEKGLVVGEGRMVFFGRKLCDGLGVKNSIVWVRKKNEKRAVIFVERTKSGED